MQRLRKVLIRVLTILEAVSRSYVQYGGCEMASSLSMGLTDMYQVSLSSMIFPSISIGAYCATGLDPVLVLVLPGRC